jgi:hypothetical protein
MKNPVVQNAASAAGKAAVKSVADSFTPAWAQEQAYQPPNVPGVAKEEKPEKGSWFGSKKAAKDADIEQPSSSNEPNRISTEDIVMSTEELNTLSKYHIALRLTYMASAILMAFSGIWYLLNAKSPALGIIFFAVYVFGFSLLLFCFECGLSTIMQIIASNFGFLYTIIGRSTFCLFVGFMCYQFNAAGWAAMGLLFASLLFHVYIMCKFPKFSAYLRKKHFEAK